MSLEKGKSEYIYSFREIFDDILDEVLTLILMSHCQKKQKELRSIKP